jgi:hypothetical protein
VLVAIVRKELGLEMSLSQILQILSVNGFEQIPLAELVTQTQSQDNPSNIHNQLCCGTNGRRLVSGSKPNIGEQLASRYVHRFHENRQAKIVFIVQPFLYNPSSSRHIVVEL